MKIISAILFLLFSSMPALGTIYKTVDEQGNVVYTDVKPKNRSSEEVKLRPLTPLQTSDKQGVSSQASNSVPSRSLIKSASYSYFEIIDPANETTIRNSGNFSVTVRLKPRLKPSHKVKLTMDGRTVGAPKRGLSFTLLNVDRGSHSLAAEVIDSQGSVVQSATSTVFVQRPIFQPDVSIN